MRRTDPQAAGLASRRGLLCLAALAIKAGACWAQPGPATPAQQSPPGMTGADREAARLLTTLQRAHPGTHFTRVERSAVPGLYEVWMGENLAYVLARAPRHFLFGRLFDTQAMQDLTAARLAQRAPAAADAAVNHPSGSTASEPGGTAAPVRFDALPLADAIRTVHGQGRRRVAVFSDPGCGHCRRLEPELAALDDVTVYTFLLPLQGDAQPRAVWCAPDPALAWQQLMRGATAPASAQATTRPDCDAPLQRNLALARQLGVQGTPTLVWADGSRTVGYVDRQVLQARLQATTGAVR